MSAAVTLGFREVMGVIFTPDDPSGALHRSSVSRMRWAVASAETWDA